MTDFAPIDEAADVRRHAREPADLAESQDTAAAGLRLQSAKPADLAESQDTAAAGLRLQSAKPADLAESQDTGELLARLQASEPNVGLHLYDRFADRVHDFVLFLTRDSALAAQTTQDVVVMTAQQEPGRLSDPADLRAWLYARARDEVFAVLSMRGRTPTEDRVIEVPDLPDNSTTADLGALVWSAMAAFSERDQALVALHLRHGLVGEDLSEAMGLSGGAVDVLLAPTLERVELQTRALLALATGRLPAGSPELQELQDSWDGMFSPMVRGRISQMLLECEPPAEDDALGPLALLQTIPLVPAPASLREAVADRLALSSAMGGLTPGHEVSADHTIPPHPSGLDEDATVPSDASPSVSVGAPAPAPIGPPPAAPTSSEAATRVGPAPRDALVPPVADARPPKLPLPLAIALGIAVGLVIAAGLLRIMAADGAPVVADAASTPVAAQAGDLTDPLSGAAGAGLEALAPGRLSVSGDQVVVGDGGAALRLTNSGGTALDWRVTAAPGWVVLDHLDGSVESGATVEVTVEMAEGLAEGDYEGAVTVAWNGQGPGTAGVVLVGAVERRPDLQNLQVGARDLVIAGCGMDRTEMAVAVIDESALDSVTVTLTGPGADTRTRFTLLPDATQPGRFVGVVGPFDQPGILSVEIAAVDARGNRAEAAGGELLLSGC